MKFNSLCAERLKSERERLGLNQSQAADICGISREMWGKYERGKSTPGGDVLFSFAEFGADIQFILTGARSPETPEEKALIENYRAMDDAARLNMQTVSATFAKANLIKDKAKDGTNE
ncbi:helix-turn-helix transcriptional regulator [Citrobacter braakii]|uniref:helix-turn-helix domain-containing protein n=1 Tax=Citrobacter braakii TaxID=57706 RepID=UPI0018EA5BD1